MVLSLSVARQLEWIYSLPWHIYPTLFVIFAIFCLALLSRWGSSSLPPSPPRGFLYFFNHPSIMFSRLPSRTFSCLQKVCGDVIYLSVFGKPVVVLNSIDDARELLDKRAANYADRSRTFVMGELYGWKNSMAFLSYGERFRTQRRMMQQTFNSKAVKIFREPQKKRVAFFLKDIVEDDVPWSLAVKRYLSANVMKATYGHEIINSDDDQFVQIAAAAARAVSSNPAGGSDIIDILPFLRHYPSWLPGGAFKRKAAIGKKLQRELQDLPYREVKSRMSSGYFENGMLPRLIADYEAAGVDDPERELNVKGVAALTYIASMNSSIVTSETFLLMMILHPDAAKAAQEEIDRKVGVSRLPDLEDRQSLPLVDCILKEVWRIHPPAPLAVPHCATEADSYKGMTIPSGSMIVPNIWNMMRDTRYFDNPERFRPERFLEKVKSYSGSEQALNALYPDDPSSVIFGFGRRTCPGRYFADGMIWLMLACALATLDFNKYVDPKTGVEETPKLECYPGQTSALLPFKYRLSARSEAHAKLIRGLTASV